MATPETSHIPSRPRARSTFAAYFAASVRNSARYERAAAIALARSSVVSAMCLFPQRGDHGTRTGTVRQGRRSSGCLYLNGNKPGRPPPLSQLPAPPFAPGSTAGGAQLWPRRADNRQLSNPADHGYRGSDYTAANVFVALSSSGAALGRAGRCGATWSVDG